MPIIIQCPVCQNVLYLDSGFFTCSNCGTKIKADFLHIIPEAFKLNFLKEKYGERRSANVNKDMPELQENNGD